MRTELALLAAVLVGGSGCNKMGAGEKPCEPIVDSRADDSEKDTQRDDSGSPDSVEPKDDSAAKESSRVDSGNDSNDCPTCTAVDQDGDGHAVNDLNEADCDDNDSTIYPGAEENCSNWKDDDCDGTIDGTNAWPDADRDGFGNETAEQMAVCGELEEGYVTNNLDCNDADPVVNPTATEVVGDSVDNNCDGTAE